MVERYFPKELYDVLKALEKEKEATAMQISDLAGVSHSFLINIIPSLKDKGFVSVVKEQKDKRKKIINLTEGGRDLLRLLEIYRATLEGKFGLIKTLLKA